MGLVKKIVRKGFILKNEYSYSNDTLTGSKALKQYKKDGMKVSVNDVEVDANIDSINYMSTVLALANSNVLALFVSGTDIEDAYKTVYEQEVPWKTANGEIKMVNIHFIKDAVEKAMYETASLIGIK